MSDLDQQLTDALTEGAEGAPSAVGLAAAARSRARERRRAQVVGGAALAVLALGVPTAVMALGGDHGGDGRVGAANRSTTAAGPHASDGSTTAPQTAWPMGGGYRWESWHDVSVRVPKDWGYGSLSDWCADGGKLTPRVQRPETVSLSILCTPASTYGVSFQEVESDDDFEWPVVHQSGSGWPKENEVGGRGMGGVLVMVATADGDQARFVLDSMRFIGPQGDANGCPSDVGSDPVVPKGGMSICRYDKQGLLEQSELLTGADVDAATAAVQAAPVDARRGPACPEPHAPTTVVRMASSELDATVGFGGGCWSDTRVTAGTVPRRLTEGVLYWALSPGWSGSVPEGVSLPSELRQQ
jgi:hypothetical protein